MLTVLLHAHIVHVAVLAAGQPKGGNGLPNPGPTPVPGLQGPLSTIVGWGKWLVFWLGVIGILICAGQMAIGRRNRHSFAADGAAGIPWVLGGASLAAIAVPLVGVFIHP